MDDPGKEKRCASIQAWHRLKQAAAELADADSEDDGVYERAVQQLHETGRAYFQRCEDPTDGRESVRPPGLPSACHPGLGCVTLRRAGCA